MICALQVIDIIDALTHAGVYVERDRDDKVVVHVNDTSHECRYDLTVSQEFPAGVVDVTLTCDGGTRRMRAVPTGHGMCAAVRACVAFAIASHALCDCDPRELKVVSDTQPCLMCVKNKAGMLVRIEDTSHARLVWKVGDSFVR